MKKFFLRVRDSIYNPAFYAELHAKPFSFSFKYFAVFSLALALLATLFVGFRYAPALRSMLAELGPQVVAHYPDELVVDIKAGQVSVNVAEPYMVPMPARLAELFDALGQEAPQNLLTIDTTQEFSLEKFRTYDTLTWLTKETLVYQGERGNIQVAPLSSDMNEQVDKQSIVLVMDKIKPVLAFMVPLFLIVSFLLAILLSLFKLLYLFIGALLIYFLARVRKINLSYKQAYQWGIHAITLPMLVNLVLFFLDFSTPFLFTAILLFVVWFNLTPRVGEVTTPLEG